MKFDVYCDESRPDLFTSGRSTATFLTIGSLWLRRGDRARFKQSIHSLRDRHHVGGEFKWQKVSPSKLAFYKELFAWFVSQGEDLRFRAIVVDSREVNFTRFHCDDRELGFYKFYYQMLHHWILDHNEYAIFCDFKSNRNPNRLRELHRCLSLSNLTATLETVQAIRSEESVLLQLADVLTGLVSAVFNESLAESSGKRAALLELERQLGRRVTSTGRSEKKLNVFRIDLAGGW